MESLELSLPSSLHDFVHRRAQETGFSSASDYVTNLLEKEQESARMLLERELLAGLDSGPPLEVTDELKRQVEERVLARIQQNQA